MTIRLMNKADEALESLIVSAAELDNECLRFAESGDVNRFRGVHRQVASVLDAAMEAVVACVVARAIELRAQPDQDSA